MKHGAQVAQFEKEFAAYVGAKYAIATANGTVTLQAGLAAFGIGPGDIVMVPPLTMAATSIAVLNVGARPDFADVAPDHWTFHGLDVSAALTSITVSLYGLHTKPGMFIGPVIDDAAQTLRPHSNADFTSYSFQRSKILNTGEGGMLVTDDEALAIAARSYLSLGYAMRADQSRIDSAAIKASDYVRHVRYPSVNGRMNDHTAELGLERLADAANLLATRRIAAYHYQLAIAGCSWLTPQHVPDGWTHDYWCYAVACDTPERARWLQAEMAKADREMPYGCWRLTYTEPAFRHLAPDGTCPIAEDLQPRLLQFQTNDRISAERNAFALRRIIDQAGRNG